MKHIGWRRAAVAVCLVFVASGLLRAQELQVAPRTVLVDESAEIYVDDLQPGERITIQASLIDGRGNPWAGQADFVADAHGSVNTSQQAPVAGSYNSVSALGLIWSMKPASGGAAPYAPPQNQPAQTVQFRLLRAGRQTSTAQMQQVRVDPDVRRTRLTVPLHGFAFLPSGDGPFPAVLVVGGSEGGVPFPRAVWLASHGFAAVALAYFRYEDLPRDLQSIPLEYFQTALRWMAQQPEAFAAGRIGVMGTSRGGELALQLGSLYPEIRAVVAYVPANVRYPACCGNNLLRSPAWALQGAPLPFFQGPLIARGRAPSGNAEIEVEKTRAPILLISGGEDELWSSTLMADAVVARLRKAGFTYPVQHLQYPHAGHMAGAPEIIPGSDRAMNPGTGEITLMGGTPAGNAESSLDSLPKVLEFLRKSLGQ